jgi:anti-sigma factor RsiW
MTEARYLELMQREIDAENSPDDSAALRAYLGTHPEARSLLAELQQLAGTLDRMQFADPPADFKDSVLEAIRDRRRHAAPMQLRTGSRVTRLKILKYAYAVAAGLILGALLSPFTFKVFRGGGNSDFSQLPGAMMRQAAFQDAAVVERRIEAAGVSGRIQLRRSAALLLVDLEVHSGQVVDITLEFDSSQLAFKGLENSDEKASSFQAYLNRLTWTQQGQLHCRVLMEGAGGEIPPMRVQVLASGRSVVSTLLPLPGLTKALK